MLRNITRNMLVKGGYFVQQYDNITKMLYHLSQLSAAERRRIAEVDKARSKSLGPILGPLVWCSPERESLLYVATSRIDYDRLYDEVSPCTPRVPFNSIHLATNPGGILFRIMDLYNKSIKEGCHDLLDVPMEVLQDLENRRPGSSFFHMPPPRLQLFKLSVCATI